MPHTTLSLAKTTRPSLSCVLPRERLYAQLDPRAGRRAVWIAAPPGSGKTTLIAGYLEARKRTALWYQLDNADADVATFFFYLRKTAAKHGQVRVEELPELPDAAADWPNHGRTLFRAVFACFKEPVTIVLDSYEAIPANSDLHAILAAALEEAPADSELVFCSRAVPPAVYARPRAAGMLPLITGAELEFSAQESEQLARIRGLTLSSAALQRIHDSAAGWVTGTILMLEHARQSRQSAPVGTEGSSELLFDYLAEEIFAKFDPPNQRFLMDVCWPRRLDLKLAEALSGARTARQMLSNLSRNNFFVSERDDAGSCEYILHPLLRDFLQAHTRRTLGEREATAAQRRTAELLLAAGQVEEAAELLASNFDWPALENLILEHAALFIEQHRGSLLSSWLDELPAERLAANGRLTYWYAESRRSEVPRDARRHFISAYHLFAQGPSNGAKGKALSICGLIETVFAEFDDCTLLDPWLPVLASTLEEAPELLDGAEGARIVCTMLLALMVRNPAAPELSGWFERANAAVRRPEYASARGEQRLYLALGYFLAGDLDRSLETLAPAGDPVEAAGPELRECRRQLLSAICHMLSGQGSTAAAELNHAFGLVDRARHDTLSALTQIGRIAAALTDADWGAADALLGELRARLSGLSRLARYFYHYLASWRALVAEEFINAHHDQRRALNCAVEIGMPFLEVLSRTALAQLLFLCGDVRNGAAQLRRVHGIVREVRNPMLEFMTLLVYGAVATQGGRSSSGANALRYALGLGRRYGFYHMPWWHPQQLGDLCVLALRNGIEKDYVRDLVVRRHLRPSSPPADVADWPWAIRIRTLGGLALERAAAAEATAAKGQARPLQLLKVLIVEGARDVPARRVAEILWPHVDSEYASRSLTINLHRLRKLLGDDNAIHLRDGRLSVDPDRVWLDLSALDQIAGDFRRRLRAVGRREDSSELDRMLQRLLDIYRGPLLPDDDAAAVFSRARTHYRAEFVGAITALADACHRRGESARARDIYEQAINRDPQAEALYRQLMAVERDAGRPDSAIDVYERCKNVLSQTSQEGPSAETRAIYQTLVRKAAEQS